MRYGSVCSGIEAATQAWHPLGWTPAFFSEIEAFPSAVLAHHYPHVPNHGDMTKFQEWPDHAIDLLVGGTPCQSFSVAGLRKGLADPRGNLMLTYLALLDRYRPRWCVWENVPGVLSSGGGRDFGAFLGGLGELGYGFAYRVLDAQYVRTCRHRGAVPQRRRRVFVIGHLGDWRRAAAVLFDRESMSGNPPPRREAGKATSASTAPSFDGCCSVSGCDRPARKRGWCNTHYQRWRKHGFVVAFSAKDYGGDAIENVSPTLRAGGHAGSHANAGVMPAVAFDLRGREGGVGRQSQSAHDPWAVRRLTCQECEFLQGFPRGFCNIPWRGKDHAPDGPQYKALGNSFAVNVAEWIGRRIQMVEDMKDA